MGELCALCPRACLVDRESQRGVCGQTNEIRAARAALHMWEEPCISGTSGSGAVFFCGCQLHCCYCQNQDIANGAAGRVISSERLSEIFLELQEKGANNINLVTPDMFVPQIIRALERAKTQGLVLPVVYNTSGYVRVETLRMLEGLVDIYLPDVKYCDSRRSERYSNAPDYFEVAAKAVAEMVRQTGDARFYYRCGAAGQPPQLLMCCGVIVRHLQLPGGLLDARHVMRYLYETYGNRICYSILRQYTPVAHLERFPEINRRLRRAEYDKLVDYCLKLGIENAYIQEEGVAQESFIPPFDGEGL